ATGSVTSDVGAPCPPLADAAAPHRGLRRRVGALRRDHQGVALHLAAAHARVERLRGPPRRGAHAAPHRHHGGGYAGRLRHGHRDVMDSLNARRWDTFWNLELPSALPYILTGMEVGIVLATIGAVVGEYLGGSEGLGSLAVSTLNALQVDTLFAVILLLTLIG